MIFWFIMILRYDGALLYYNNNDDDNVIVLLLLLLGREDYIFIDDTSSLS